MNNENYTRYLTSLRTLIDELLHDDGDSSRPVIIPDVFFSNGFEVLLNEIRSLKSEIKSQPLKCRLDDSKGSPSYNEFLVATSSRLEGLKEIRDFTRDADALTIIDPYIYSGSIKDKEQILKSFLKATMMDSSSGAKKIHIIYDKGNEKKKTVTPGIRKLILSEATKYKCQIIETSTSLIHDRIWIVNNKKAIVVGTSLTGIGGRLCFILPLPNEDLKSLLGFLKDNQLLTT